MQQNDTIWIKTRTHLRNLKRFMELIYNPIFKLNGSKPHTFGYQWSKENQIKKSIKKSIFNHKKLPEKYGLKIDERIIEFPWFMSRIPTTSGRLLDAGSALNHKFLLENEILKNKSIIISTLAPESNSWWRKNISYVYEDFRFSCFRDGYFDWISCISTLEHVGLDNTLLYTNDNSKKELSENDALIVIKELRRMLRKDGKLYLTFPYGKHANYAWFKVFDANGLEELATAFKPVERIDTYFKYTLNGWEIVNPEELVDADYFDPHTPSTSNTHDSAAGARGLVCLEWTA